MKKIIAIFLVLTLCLASCKSNNNPSATATSNTSDTVSKTASQAITSTITSSINENSSEVTTTVSSENIGTTVETSNVSSHEEEVEFYSMDDPALLEYVENSIYTELVSDLNNENFIVEDIQATYMPDEYYENLEFNSQENIYFGHTASELNEVFQGKKYVFTLGDNGQTVVQEMEVLEDHTYEEMIKNVAIGAGIILVCVTVSVVSGGAGAPAAVTIIFSMAAKEATNLAFKAFEIGKVSATAVKGVTSGSVKDLSQSDLLKMSENFKWGAIVGATKGAINGIIKSQ